MPARVWWLVGGLLMALARRRAALAGDLDRDHAAASLREHYAGGYLTLDEFTRRTGRALSARSRGELRRALSGLSQPSPVDSARSTVRDLVLVVVSGAYVLFTLTLAFVVALTFLLGGASTSTLVVFLLVWLAPTYVFTRFRRRNARR